MLLAIDAGNTNTKLGLFEGDRLRAQWRLATRRDAQADEWGVYVRTLCAADGLDPRSIAGCVIASVVPTLTGQLAEMARRHLGREPLLVRNTTDHGLVLEGRPADRLGADRIANCVGARVRYGWPCLVVALGTATAIDCVDAGGRYLGGVIAPGVHVSAAALFGAGAMLYEVDLEPPERVLGVTTREQLRSGIVCGFGAMVDGLVRRLRAEIGADWPAYATGGHAEAIAAHAPALTAVVPHLTLTGLCEIHRRVRGPE